MSPVYTTATISGSARWIWAIAVHKTRSPPPPALLQGYGDFMRSAVEGKQGRVSDEELYPPKRVKEPNYFPVFQSESRDSKITSQLSLLARFP